MPKTFVVRTHPFNIATLSNVLDQCNPGQGQIARRRFEELWDDVQSVVAPAGKRVEWLNPTMSEGDLAKARGQKGPDGSPLFGSDFLWDPERMIELRLSEGSLEDAKRHLAEFLDRPQLTWAQVRLLKPIEKALADAVKE